VDGRSAAADGTSQWITGPAARADVHRHRAVADAIVVGTGNVLNDDSRTMVIRTHDPLEVLQALADRTDVILEGGPTLAGAFVRAGLVDRILAYLAPTLLGGPITARFDGVVTVGADVRLSLVPN
ncbi:RibD family protein, partial [Mycolicibacterium mucogenicum]|uniref:RibD family protein n=1 Tax=Mycolicibacterium mucogenicum TaxID=56689 RepID=UPI000B24B7F3